MTMADRSNRFSPLENFFGQETFLSILNYYVDLNCFVIPAQPVPWFSDEHHRYPTSWVNVHYHRRPVSVYDFEKKYKRTDEHRKAIDHYSRQAHKAQRTVYGEHLGFYDLYVPILRD